MNFRGLTAGFARLPTFSRTFIAGYICLTKNKIWVFHPGGICPILLHPNTCDLLLLLFYTTVSLDFGRYPISELTTHSPRMGNDQYHAHTPDLKRCDRVYEMQSCHFMLCHATCTIRAICNIYKFWIIILPTYNFHVNTSRKHIFTCFLQTITYYLFFQQYTQNGPNLGPI